jgi:hypothetical protein
MANGFQGPPIFDFYSSLSGPATQQQRSPAAAGRVDFRSSLGGAAPAAGPAATAAPAAGPGGYGGAISSIESGGRYDLRGPVTRNGDQALGKYQVMGNNVGPWTREALGHELTPEQFLADPKAQDAVFDHKFGQYAEKYGPTGAARAWFAGEGGMNDPTRKDALGTTVQAYGDKFDKAYGGAN